MKSVMTRLIALVLIAACLISGIVISPSEKTYAASETDTAIEMGIVPSGWNKKLTKKADF